MAKLGSVKTDNHPASRAAKIELRELVLGQVQPARVFDAFCGVGEMYRAVWHRAEAYAGCDSRDWEPTHSPRYVADNRRLLRCLDLSKFNVFDFDAYGSPWEQMTILAARRKWAEGERGGVLLTDGSSLKARWGGLPHAMALMAGMDTASRPPTTSGIPEIMGAALHGWVKRAGVEVLRMWQAQGKAPAEVLYTAVVFVGAGQRSEP